MHLHVLAILFLLPLVMSELSLVILHNNDMHSRFEETSRISSTCSAKDKRNHRCYGGFARTAHIVREHRRLAKAGQIPAVLFLNAGDVYTGSAWFSVFQWKICVEFVNALQPDALSLGNHEFDNGDKGLSPYVNNLASPIVAANLNCSKVPALQKIKKSVVLDVDGVRIGVIGYLTPETKYISSPDGIEFFDEVKSIKRESEKLDKDGVKILIALGHSGYLIDQKIAKEVPLIDIVVGGHTNTFLYTGPPPDLETPEDDYPKVVVQESGKKVPVVQAYAYTKYLGRLNVTFNDKGDLTSFGGAPLLITSDIQQEQDVLDMLDRYRPEIDALEKQVVGTSKVLLDASNNICRRQECNFGNLIADAYVAYVAQWNPTNYWTHVPIALINGGGIRSSVDAIPNGGNITRGALMAAQPFGNTVFTFSLTGENLLKTIEIGVRSNGETSKGEFLQFSGIHVVYDMNNPVGSRVVSAEARCAKCLVPIYEPIQLNKTYNIVSTRFLLDGGDNHYVLKEHAQFKKQEDLSDLDILAWYIKHYSPVYPEIQGRISFVENNKSGALSSGNRLEAYAIAIIGAFIIACL